MGAKPRYAHAVCALAVVVAVAAGAWLFAPAGDNTASAAAVAAPVAGAAAADHGRADARGAWSASPFGSGAPVTGAERLPAQVLARQEKMVKLGYATPEQYYRMGLAQLQALARKGDADAMFQLAEQYQERAGSLLSDPAYPRGADLDALAKGCLESAFNAGRSRAAALLAKRLLDENNLVDAYTWHVMSGQTGGGSLFDPGADPFAQLSDAEKNLAREKFALIAAASARAQEAARFPGPAR